MPLGRRACIYDLTTQGHKQLASSGESPCLPRSGHSRCSRMPPSLPNCCASFGATDRTDIPLRIVCNPFQNKFLERYHPDGYSVIMKHLDLRHALTSLPTAARLVQATAVCAL